MEPMGLGYGAEHLGSCKPPEAQIDVRVANEHLTLGNARPLNEMMDLS
jgi:hypothetical protein